MPSAHWSWMKLLVIRRLATFIVQIATEGEREMSTPSMNRFSVSRAEISPWAALRVSALEVIRILRITVFFPETNNLFIFRSLAGL